MELWLVDNLDMVLLVRENDTIYLMSILCPCLLQEVDCAKRDCVCLNDRYCKSGVCYLIRYRYRVP